ncbi:MAG TPA: NYN domain-containing protein [Acidimicrobiales bacterium]|nr:NYN domain-containing protein [Acidimicrobiales bacterium]
MSVARAGEEATPVVPAPTPLRPFLQFAKLPGKAVGAARRAVESDEEFRARVAETVAEEDVGRAGWLWLTRPPGWEADLDELARDADQAGEAAAERRAENEARRRLAGAEAATQRAEAAAAAALAEAARASEVLADERRARRAAVLEAEGLARRLDQAATERDRARAERDRAREERDRAQARIAELKGEVDELRRRPPPPPPGPPARSEPGDDTTTTTTAAAGAALLAAATAAAGMAESLRQAATALGAETPVPAAATEPPPGEPEPRRPRPRPPRRLPAPVPPGVLDDSVEAADHLVRVPGMTVLVDGYNVSQTGWPDLPIAEQRRRLVDALAELAARSGADVSVVFDGADPVWPAMVPATARLVKVSFSPADVEADDVLLARVADLDPSRPVLVASSDRRVRDGAAAMGANVVSSPQLLAALRR